MTYTEYKNILGVPDFACYELNERSTKYCICIPIINEGERIRAELIRALEYNVDKVCDIIICDGGSTDGSTELDILEQLNVNTLLVKKGIGKQGAQLRMGFWWALARGYQGIITIDGNNKDSIEDVERFVEKLDTGYDFIQGSRYIKGGTAINTPLIRHLSVKLIHAPIISLTAKYHFTDTTNAYRGYSRKYLQHEKVQPFREVFQTYELLAYLSVRATQLGLRVCEIPVRRAYPLSGPPPTKISMVRGNWQLMRILINNLRKQYHPADE